MSEESLTSSSFSSSSNIDDDFPVTTIAERAALLSVEGKLRGSRARQLGDRLTALANDGIARVVLDFRTLMSIDSLGTFALEEGLDVGLRIHLVVRPSFEFDEFFASRSLGRRGLRIHRSLEDALNRVRRVMDSTILV